MYTNCNDAVFPQRKSKTTKTEPENQIKLNDRITELRGTVTLTDFSWFITTNRPFHHKIILFLAALVYFGKCSQTAVSTSSTNEK